VVLEGSKISRVDGLCYVERPTDLCRALLWKVCSRPSLGKREIVISELTDSYRLFYSFSRTVKQEAIFISGLVSPISHFEWMLLEESATISFGVVTQALGL
jgi:hypothetical protein